MKILIIGAGAVGGFYGAKLACGGEEVIFLARGKSLEALKNRPLKIQSFQGDFEARVSVIAHPSEISSPDLILIAVKSYDTNAAIEQIRSLVADNTLLIPLQNGVENEFQLAAAFGRKKVLGSVCYIGAEAVAPGEILHSAKGSIAIGELDGRESDRAKKIVAAFEKSKTDVHLSLNIQKERWVKLAWNTAFNQVCTVARADVGSVLDSPPMRELLKDAMREVFTIAERHGVLVDAETMIEMSLALSEEELRAVRPSMLQDFERGRRLEHETFSGFLVREGNRLNVTVPVNTVLYRFLSFLDSYGRAV